jgi:RimJ/RimL family protein N-acetyltransferase
MFSIIAKESNHAVGSCGFKAPPDEQGAVEIAYGVDEPFQSQGFTFVGVVEDPEDGAVNR